MGSLLKKKGGIDFHFGTPFYKEALIL